MVKSPDPYYDILVELQDLDSQKEEERLKREFAVLLLARLKEEGWEWGAKAKQPTPVKE